jgi:hypothetical protein
MTSEEEVGLDAAGETFGRAKCILNVWDRVAYAAEKRKVSTPVL